MATPAADAAADGVVAVMHGVVERELAKAASMVKQDGGELAPRGWGAS